MAGAKVQGRASFGLHGLGCRRDEVAHGPQHSTSARRRSWFLRPGREILAPSFFSGSTLPPQDNFAGLEQETAHRMGRPRAKQPTNGVKRELAEDTEHPRTHPAKKTKMLDDSDDEADGDGDGGVSFNINADYARRFEHNKKREEQHRRT
jgi:hypothetical protein